MASIITAIILVLAVFFIVPWLFFLPKCVLSAIITTVVYSSKLTQAVWKLTSVLTEAPHEIIFYYQTRAWTDFLQMVGTFVITLCFSIEVS